MSLRKLKQNYAFLYDQASLKGHQLDPWRSAYNRMLRELVLDFQEAKKYPNPTYFSKQASILREQAKSISIKDTMDDPDWSDIFMMAKESSIFTETVLDQDRQILNFKCFSMMQPIGLSEASIINLANLIGGYFHRDSGYIRLNIMALQLFIKPNEKTEERLISISRSVLLEHIDALAASDEKRKPFKRPWLSWLRDYLFLRSVQ